MSLNKLGHCKVCVLLSGGIDSSACVAFYLEQKFSVKGMFIDYGQPANHREAIASRSVADYYSISLSHIKMSGIEKYRTGFIPGRNAFLLSAGLMEVSKEVGILAIGIHSGTDYFDCSAEFITKMQAIFDGYSMGCIQIGTPFLKWTKHDVWRFCQSKKVPLKFTYSCELGLGQPCGKCDTCQDLEKLNAIT